jgi:carbamate kinase
MLASGGAPYRHVMRIVIALGGNAMTAPDGSARPSDQRDAVEAAADSIAALITAGVSVVLTHGNGPQVGNLLVKNELAAAVVPPVGLDWCGAQTQGTIGFLLLNALDRALSARASDVRTAVVVSRTLVLADDPAFLVPTKPIGRYVDGPTAAVMAAHGQEWQDRGDRGWRRVVASPDPVQCLDSSAVTTLLEAGYVVVCSGGGGIPVVRAPDGSLTGVEAVVDKDLTAALLATELHADLLVIATDVSAAVIGWGTDAARSLGNVSLDELRAHWAAGEFASGSMGPKVDAVCRFAAANPGKRAAITSLDRIADAVVGTAGTIVTVQ